MDQTVNKLEEVMKCSKYALFVLGIISLQLLKIQI